MRYCLAILLLSAGCGGHLGSAASSDYHASGPVPALQTVTEAGDYALYYDGNPKPEIPIRLKAGDSLGFTETPDGRVQAVAGAFRMNLSADATGARWKRYEKRQE